MNLNLPPDETIDKKEGLGEGEKDADVLNSDSQVPENGNEPAKHLWLKINRPSGKPFRFMFPGTNDVDKSKKPVTLLNNRPPSRPLSVEEEEWLIGQDGTNLVSRTKPDFSKMFSTKEDELKYVLTEKEEEIEKLKSENLFLKNTLESGGGSREALSEQKVISLELQQQVNKVLEENKQHVLDKDRLNKEIVVLQGAPKVVYTDPNVEIPEDNSVEGAMETESEEKSEKDDKPKKN